MQGLRGPSQLTTDGRTTLLLLRACCSAITLSADDSDASSARQYRGGLTFNVLA